MRISPTTLATIKSCISIEEVIRDFLPLKKKGNGHTLWGCCPFHHEKTPSFAVQAEKGFYKCFGCGKAGDAIRFLEEKEGLSYLESMRYLADKYGVSWDEEVVSDQEKKLYDSQEKLSILLQIVVAYYREQLNQHPQAKQYLKNRGIGDDQADLFQLGYSLHKWRAVYDFVLAKGYNEADLTAVGLILRKDSQVYDRFRGRLMFPLQDALGRVVGLAGRELADSSSGQAKYINSPETVIYHKSRLLYGLFQAKKSIRQQDQGYLVEGYTDVLAFHRAGIENVVASGGTSLTQEQIQLFKRYSQHIVLVFDGDQAGTRAALRSINLFLTAGMEVKVVVLPPGEDPDSLIRQRGATVMQDYLAKNSQNFLSFIVQHLLPDQKSDPAAFTAAMNQVVHTLSMIREPAKRGVYIQLASQLTGMSPLTWEEAVRAITDQDKPYARPVKVNQNRDRQQEAATTANDEKRLLHLLFNYGSIRLDDGRSLATYFLAETQDITFEVAQHEALLQAYQEACGDQDATDGQAFLMSLPEELTQIAIDIMAEKEEIIQGWESQHQGVTSSLTHGVGELVRKNILRRKMKIVSGLLHDQLLHITQVNQQEDEASLEEAVATYEALKALQIQIGKQLGNVIIAR
ncbi:MAG: DNA primase [Bacteroidota bacterium]